MENGAEPAAPAPETPWWGYGLRLLWMAVRLILVLCLGQRGVLFLYQGF